MAGFPNTRSDASRTSANSSSSTWSSDTPSPTRVLSLRAHAVSPASSVAATSVARRSIRACRAMYGARSNSTDEPRNRRNRRFSGPAVWQFGPPRTPTSCFPAASSTCIDLSDERQRRYIAPSLHLVNPRYSITVRRVVQPPNNAVHNVFRSPIGDHNGRHRLLGHGYHSDAFSRLLCLGQFGNQPPLPFILPRSAFAGHEPIGVLLVQDARPPNQRRSICIRHLPDY